MGKPEAPKPSQRNCNRRPPPVVIRQRVTSIVVNEHYRDHSPVQIDHPVAGKSLADDPEEDVDVEEEEDVG